MKSEEDIVKKTVDDNFNEVSKAHYFIYFTSFYYFTLHYYLLYLLYFICAMN